MVVNLLLIRVLLAHVVLRPWKCGIGPRPTTEASLKTVSHNLRVIASSLFLVFEKLVPSLQSIKVKGDTEQMPSTDPAPLMGSTDSTVDSRRLDELDARPFLSDSDFSAILLPDSYFDAGS